MSQGATEEEAAAIFSETKTEEPQQGPTELQKVEVPLPKIKTSSYLPNENITEREVSAILRGSNDVFLYFAKKSVGQKYVWAGNDPSSDGGLDCSGHVLYSLNQMDNNIEDRTASEIYTDLTTPVIGDPQSGDLRFLRDENGNIVHVQVIVSSDGTRINATGTRKNDINNPGVIEVKEGPLPLGGEIRRINWE